MFLQIMFRHTGNPCLPISVPRGYIISVIKELCVLMNNHATKIQAGVHVRVALIDFVE
jgi:hypothetical protein